MSFKDRKRDDHGHVISNDEVDGQKCKHQSGGNKSESKNNNRQDIQNKLDTARNNLKKVNDVENIAKYNREIDGLEKQLASMPDDSFDDDYDEEFNAYKEPDARPNHTKLKDMNLSDSEIWNMAYQYIGNDKLEKLAEQLDLDSPQDLSTSDLLKYMPDDDIGDMMRLNGLDEDFEDESQEEYEARIKPEVEKFKKQLDDAGYKLKDKEYGLEDAIKNADGDVLDDYFGKDTSERKLAGAIKQSQEDNKPQQVKKDPSISGFLLDKFGYDVLKKPFDEVIDTIDAEWKGSYSLNDIKNAIKEIREYKEVKL